MVRHQPSQFLASLEAQHRQQSASQTSPTFTPVASQQQVRPRFGFVLSATCGCSHRFRVPRSDYGGSTACPKCQAQFDVPQFHLQVQG